MTRTYEKITQASSAGISPSDANNWVEITYNQLQMYFNERVTFVGRTAWFASNTLPPHWYEFGSTITNGVTMYPTFRNLGAPLITVSGQNLIIAPVNSFLRAIGSGSGNPFQQVAPNLRSHIHSLTTSGGVLRPGDSNNFQTPQNNFIDGSLKPPGPNDIIPPIQFYIMQLATTITQTGNPSNVSPATMINDIHPIHRNVRLAVFAGNPATL